MTQRFYKIDADMATRTDLPLAAKCVYAVIANRIGDNGVCWPSVRGMGLDWGIGKNAVARAIRQLEKVGLIVVEHGGHHHPNRYRLGTGMSPKQGQSENGNVPATGTIIVPKTGQELEPVKRTTLTCARKPPKKPRRKRTQPVTWDAEAEQFIVPPKVLEHWVRDFPEVDVQGEIRRAGAWHASKQKWRSAFKRSLAAWLARSAKDVAKDVRGGKQPIPDPTADRFADLTHDGDPDEVAALLEQSA